MFKKTVVFPLGAISSLIDVNFFMLNDISRQNFQKRQNW